MRLIVYGPYLIVCCALIQTAFAESKNYKRSRDNEDNSVERTSKYKGEKKYKAKYRTDADDESEEDYRIKHHKKQWDEGHDFAKEMKYSKYSRKANVDPEEEQSYSKSRKSFDRKGKDLEGSGRFGKKKSFITGEDSDEDSNENFRERKSEFRRDNKFDKRKFEEKTSAEKTAKTKKYSGKRMKDINDDDDGEDSEEETAKFEKKTVRKTKHLIDDFEESEEEEVPPKKKFRKKIRVRVPDSPEEDSDESDEDGGGTCERKSKKGKGRKNCLTEESVNGDGEAEDEPAHPKKIKYSIKFAHEKEKNVPSEDDNIMLKIHRGEKKKYKYQDDDDDGSSEENAFPKRIRFVDDDED